MPPIIEDLLHTCLPLNPTSIILFLTNLAMSILLRFILKESVLITIDPLCFVSTAGGVGLSLINVIGFLLILMISITNLLNPNSKCRKVDIYVDIHEIPTSNTLSFDKFSHKVSDEMSLVGLSKEQHSHVISLHR